MLFTVNGKDLKTELDNLNRIVEKKTTIPILSTILIDADNGSVNLTGTDLDLFLISPLRHDAQEYFVPGALCVSAHELTKMTAGLTGNITFETDGEKLKVTSGKVKVSLSTRSKDDFPIIPEIKGKPQIALTGDLIRSMVKNTVFAVTKEESRFTLAGFKFVSDKKTVKIVTTDGHRLAYTGADKGFQCDAEIDVLMRKQALIEAAKLSNGSVSITHEKDHIRFLTGGRTLISRRLDGNFPNYEMVMPKDNDKAVTFDIATFRDVAKRSLAVADPRTFALYVNISDGQIEVEAGYEDALRSESLDASYTGEPTRLGFNAKYLHEYLAVASPGTGKLSFKGKENQVEFTIDGYEYDFRYIVMPFRT